MKILFLCRSLNVGGVEKNLLLLTEEFVGRGHTVGVGAAPGPIADMLEKAGARCWKFSFTLAKPWLLWHDMVHLSKVIAQERPDIVHVFSAAPAVALAFAKTFWPFMLHPHKRPFPIVVSSVMGLQTSPNESLLVTQFRNFLISLGATRVFIISTEIGRLLRKLPIRKNRLKDLAVVGVKLPKPGVITQTLKDDFKSRHNIPMHARVISTVGRLDPEKSHDLFITAMADVIRTRDDVVCLIAGEGRLHSSLQDQIDRIGLSNQVRLLGQCGDVNTLLSISTAYVKPGIVEGFIGITVLEAQAIGVPVVAFDTQDVRMAIDDGLTGYIVPAGNTKLLAERLGAIIDEPEKYREMTNRARAFVEKTFSIGSVADGLLAAYQNECCAG